jgi:Holliday junction DNA helicase RuvB
LSAPLRDRFGVSFHLEFYEPEELMRIIERSAGLLSIPIDKDAALELARRSRGTPRIANKLLRRVRDYAQVKAHDKISMDTVHKALKGHGVDSQGLDALDRKVLKTLIEVYGGGPVGVESLSATLNEEVDTLVDVVEPYLLKIGFLKRTSRGREAAPSAYKHLEIPYAKKAGLFE